MSSDGSSVWEDVVRVWTDTDAVSAKAVSEGRNAPAWWRLLGLNALSFVFFAILSERLNSSILYDAFFGIPSGPPLAPREAFFLWLFVAFALSCLCLIQWLLLPRFAKIFGGSYNRADVNLTYYFFFAIGFGSFWFSSALEIFSVLVAKINVIAGGYLNLFGSVVLFIIASIMCARIAKIVQQFPSRRRAFGAVLLSFLAASVVLLFILFALLVGIFFVFPEYFEGGS